MSSATVRRHPFTHLRLLCGIGILAVVALICFGTTGLALLAVCAATVGFEWLVAPVMVQRIMRTRVVPNDGKCYLARPGSDEERVGRILARRCEVAARELVRLEFVDIDEPNAFTYGRSARAPRMVLTTGLVRRLSDDELDAVICHELGHIHHRDVVLMTLLSLIPAMCYFAARALMTMDDDSDDDEGDLLIFVLGFLVLYAVTELLLLAVSRSREYDADRWAFDQMGNAEPLVSALIVVTHAADEATAAVERRRDEVAALPRKERKHARRALRPAASTSMVHALALAHPTRTDSNVDLRAMSPGDYRQHLRDDADRRRWYQDLFATHPPLSLRVRALSTHEAVAVPAGTDQRRSLRQRATMSSASKQGR